MKVYNYGSSIWAINTKHSDGHMIENCLKKCAANDLDEMMNLKEIEDVFLTLNTLLYQEKNLQLIDFEKVVKIDLIEKVAEVLS